MGGSVGLIVTRSPCKFQELGPLMAAWTPSFTTTVLTSFSTRHALSFMRMRIPRPQPISINIIEGRLLGILPELSPFILERFSVHPPLPSRLPKPLPPHLMPPHPLRLSQRRTVSSQTHLPRDPGPGLLFAVGYGLGEDERKARETQQLPGLRGEDVAAEYGAVEGCGAPDLLPP